uniref:Uncharacterized protein n=1 Tax=Trachydiscus minutus TaxID=1032745 RepID=A0A140F2Q3_9STRA|nr:hypothetical protein [Trachydiscus minutus]AML60687.1 hypothetical protein [Trachydiscus minutus]
MLLSPLDQFRILPILPDNIGSFDILFTNSVLILLIALGSFLLCAKKKDELVFHLSFIWLGKLLFLAQSVTFFEVTLSAPQVLTLVVIFYSFLKATSCDPSYGLLPKTSSRLKRPPSDGLLSDTSSICLMCPSDNSELGDSVPFNWSLGFTEDENLPGLNLDEDFISKSLPSYLAEAVSLPITRENLKTFNESIKRAQIGMVHDNYRILPAEDVAKQAEATM